jgi:hypothetical protein
MLWSYPGTGVLGVGKDATAAGAEELGGEQWELPPTELVSAHLQVLSLLRWQRSHRSLPPLPGSTSPRPRPHVQPSTLLPQASALRPLQGLSALRC